jgi:hypothetical protein
MFAEHAEVSDPHDPYMPVEKSIARKHAGELYDGVKARRINCRQPLADNPGRSEWRPGVTQRVRSGGSKR